MRKITLPHLFNRLYALRLSLIAAISTPYCRLIFRLKGVHLKKGSKFYGIPFIFLHSNSYISLGENIQIRTSRISNFIGINRRTMLSTHCKDAQIIIGDNCSFTSVVIGARSSITIGNKVMVGANVLITDTDWHSMDPNLRETGTPDSKPVYIADNVFIGYSTTVLKGVKIGKNSVIGANSVVSKDIPENVVAAGNPCKIIKSLC
jgi:acetyltransferase-like isoleucine patch superfamily enzyme